MRPWRWWRRRTYTSCDSHRAFHEIHVEVKLHLIASLHWLCMKSRGVHRAHCFLSECTCSVVCYVGDRLRPVPSYLVTDVQREDEGQHAGGRVTTVTLGPTITNILKEHRVHHQNLNTHTPTHTHAQSHGLVSWCSLALCSVFKSTCSLIS